MIALVKKRKQNREKKDCRIKSRVLKKVLNIDRGKIK